jgi:hypothetical protein
MAEPRHDEAPKPNGRDRLDASVAGQKIGLSTNNLIAVLFIGLIGVLLWLFWGSGQVIMQRDIADRHRIAQEHERAHAEQRQEHQRLRQVLEDYHTADMARQLEVARAMLKVLLNMDYNIRHEGEKEDIPFGELPPWFSPSLRPESR